MEKIHVMHIAESAGGARRDEMMDVMKGVGILLVVFAHTYHGLASGIVYLFHMPLFFLLSGAAINYSRRFCIGRKIKTLVVPYLVFSLLTFGYWALVESKFRPVHPDALFIGIMGTWDYRLQQFLNIFIAVGGKSAFLYNVVMWFLPCLFSATMVYEGLRRKDWRLRGALICIAFYCVASIWLPRLPWYFEIAMLCVPLLYLGEVGYCRLKGMLERSNKLKMVIGGYIVNIHYTIYDF